MSRHLRVGEAGEEIAVRHLRQKGMRILERRARVGRYEIDIVARQGREWVFIEVKTRSTRRFGAAAEGVSEKKRNSLRRAVEEYVRRYGLEREPLRCDLVAVDILEDGSPSVQHYPGGAW